METVGEDRELTIEELVGELHTARVNLDNSNQMVRQVEADFKAESARMYEHDAEAKKQVEFIEAVIRKRAVEQYEADPDRKKEITPGVGIRISNAYVYLDGEAFDWAMEHKMCLDLNGKAFEAICKDESTRPDFVEVREVPQVTIARDLGKVYGAGNKEAE